MPPAFLPTISSHPQLPFAPHSMVNQPAPSLKKFQKSRRSPRDEARARISEGLRRRASSPVVKTKASHLESTAPSIQSGDLEMLDEPQMEQDSSLPGINGLRRLTTSPFVVEEVSAHSDNGDQGVFDEPLMEQGS